jgi:proline racemase
MKNFELQFSREWPRITSIDMHTGGEPLRIVTGGLPPIPGQSITDKIRFFKLHFDHWRTRLIGEPRGHSDMYAAVLTDAVHPDSDFGVFFLHNEGYSSMCGHAIIALTTLLARSSPKEGDGIQHYRFDVPSGQVAARAEFKQGELTEVSFENVPSFVVLKDLEIVHERLGKVRVDLAYGGAFYAYLNVLPHAIDLGVANSGHLIQLGREIKALVESKYQVQHPFNADLSFLYGVIFYGPSHSPGMESRNVCIFADGELDRSATGTGVSGKAALLYASGKLPLKKAIQIESISGSSMKVEVLRELVFGPYRAIVPKISGSAYLTGQHEFIFDESDPLVDGFFIR